MKAVIFDMDGTMIDNMMVHHHAWKEAMARYGHEFSLEEVHREFHGVNTEILKRLFGDSYTPAERQRISDEKESIYQANYKSSIALLPGLPGFFEALGKAGIPVALASAAPAINVDFVLGALGLEDIFSSILHAGDVTKGKPHPEIYLRTAEILGIQPEDCLVFEDSPAGARAASAAGCEIGVVCTTHQPDDFSGIEGINCFIQDFSDPYILNLI